GATRAVVGAARGVLGLARELLELARRLVGFARGVVGAAVGVGELGGVGRAGAASTRRAGRCAGCRRAGRRRARGFVGLAPRRRQVDRGLERVGAQLVELHLLVARLLARALVVGLEALAVGARRVELAGEPRDG